MSAFNGSGTFVISGVGLPYVTGTTISSTVANQLNTDLATGLSNVICKDGQTTPTANLPMGAFKHTGAAAATATGQYLVYGQAAGTGGIVGTATNDNATAGNIGEFISSSATGVALTNATNANITTISLTAGDWDVSGTIVYSPTGATISSISAGISSTSATLPALAVGGFAEISASISGAGTATSLPTPTYRFSLSGTTTIYLVGEVNFSAGSVSGAAYLRARRAR